MLPMDDDIKLDEFIHDLVQVFRWAALEPILAGKMERVLKPKPVVLAATPEDAETLRLRVETLSERLGAPSRLSITIDGKESGPASDEYGASALQELFTYFWRCRRPLVRAHLLFLTIGVMKNHKEYWKEQISEEEFQSLIDSVTSNMWEGFETTYIRLASYWDRAGQLLDFLFFNVRHYDREGFGSVMEKIHNNFSLVLPTLGQHSSWKSLIEFHRSEQPDGFKWLVRRRNLLVHSLHLRPLDNQPEEPLFRYTFNHLDDKLRNKLKPSDPKTELDTLHSQLSRISTLLSDVLTLSEFAIDKGIHMTVHD